MNHTTPIITDPRTVFAGAVATATAVVDGVRDDQLHLPTPCAEYDVARLLEHLVEVMQRVEALGAGTDPFALAGVDPALGAAETFRRARHDVERAWADDEVLDRSMTLPWVVAPGRTLIGTYTNELCTHTWDLATATGQQPAWDHHVLGAAMEAIRLAMPAVGRTQRFDDFAATLPAGVPFAAPFGAAVEVADDAPLIDRLVAWNGRRPGSTDGVGVSSPA